MQEPFVDSWRFDSRPGSAVATASCQEHRSFVEASLLMFCTCCSQIIVTFFLSDYEIELRDAYGGKLACADVSLRA